MSDGTRVIDRWAEHLVERRFEDLDAATVALATLRVVDVVGCALGGMHCDGNEALVALTRRWGGAGEATIIGHGGRVPAPQAALVNAILARSNDFEVMSFVRDGVRLPSHNAGSTVPTALALAEARGLTGRDLLTALVLGDDLVARVSLAQNWNFYQGFDGIGSLVPWGTTAVAGKLLGLDARRQKHAFGLALNTMGGSIQSIWDGAHAFKYVQGTPARDGIVAAELAAADWTGVDDTIGARFGYFTLFADGMKDEPALTDGLGERYFGEALFKAYPCGLPNHIPIECALALRATPGFEVDDVESVEIRVTAQAMRNYYAQPFEIREFPQADAIFSYRYSVATALRHGHVGIEHYTEEAVRDRATGALIDRMRVVALPEGRIGAEVEIGLRDGRTIRHAAETASAEPLTHPATESDVHAKFLAQAEFAGVLGRSRAEELLDMLMHLETLDDLGPLLRLATGSAVHA